VSKTPKTITGVPDKKGRRLVVKFDRAAQNKAFEGAAHPDDQDGIAKAYELTKKRLLAHLDEQALTIHDLHARLEDR
jgi:hypothetical protein